MSFAKSERAALCDLLDEVGPQAPTLCAGWTAHDMAAHLWTRETDPLAAPGIVVKPLAGLTERRLAEAKARWPYAELVDKVRHGPAPASVFSFPGVDLEANTVEYFVHHEDVRRAQPDWGVRQLPDSVEDWLWRRLKLMARVMFRGVGTGLVLERAVQVPGDTPETIRALPGNEIVTLIGTPSELLLFAYGRGTHAVVEMVGPDDAVAKVRAARLAV
ncbi:TIGR03085 family metal-binding protein [Granulicoccus phenolivorans]|uniref:TIGR03085 family metal-binding protein n=1 Tax=Granulicoccus phenolivorans TaxID=266854 RepID=UPI0004050CD4|nr:TIGR03085 family metal-binding protein [Granulicoccus phenolivorans]